MGPNLAPPCLLTKGQHNTSRHNRSQSPLASRHRHHVHVTLAPKKQLHRSNSTQLNESQQDTTGTSAEIHLTLAFAASSAKPINHRPNTPNRRQVHDS
jgi:hypothetical protein